MSIIRMQILPNKTCMHLFKHIHRNKDPVSLISGTYLKLYSSSLENMPWPCDWKNFMSKNGVSFKVLNGTKQPNSI